MTTGGGKGTLGVGSGAGLGVEGSVGLVGLLPGSRLTLPVATAAATNCQ